MHALDVGLLVLRVVVGLTFFAHGAQKAFGWWSGPGVAGWETAIGRMGYRPVRFWSAVSILAELSGLLLALGILTPFVAALLVGHTAVIIGLAHWAKGFWNANGGIEFSATLGAGALAILAGGAGTLSLDEILGFSWSDQLRLVLIVVAIVGGLAALAVPHLGRVGARSGGNSPAATA